MKIAIEQFDKNAHDKALKIGKNGVFETKLVILTNLADERFDQGLQPDKFHDFMLKETKRQKKDNYLKGYLSRIIRANDAPPGKVTRDDHSTSLDIFSLRLVS